MVRIRKKDDELAPTAPTNVWTPDAFLRDMDRMFRELRSGFEDMFYPLSEYGIMPERGIRIPAVDVRDTGKDIVISAEMPGIRKEDVNIEVGESSVVIKGESKEEEERKEGNFYHKERIYAQFHREIPLPEEVVGSEAKASMKNGVLELVLPKKEPTEQKRFSVKVD